ncbi:MAG: YqcC family protein [Thiohalomonadaceae bacterium]
MTANTRLHHIADLLLTIEQEMRCLGLWEETPPATEDLLSTVPFCHDTLEFTQWLQWVFLQRMRELLQMNATLPAACEIHPLAEHTFLELPQDTRRLLELIAAIDKALSQT